MLNERYTVSKTPKRPTLKAVQALWSKNKDVDAAFIRGQFEHAEKVWLDLYAQKTPAESNALTKKAVAAMRFKWTGVEPYERFTRRFGRDGVDDVLRAAVRPWPADGWRGVEVGNTKFGKTPRANQFQRATGLSPLRKSDTPRDFYRMLFLFKPTGVDFDDMYGQGLCGIVSPCHRFAMNFYFHKYELAAYQRVEQGLAVRTRPERGLSIICGIPGVGNGVATTDEDAQRWFQMIDLALGREWDVYGGNNFRV